MFKILSREQFSDCVYRLVVDAPRIARTRKAGQFIALRVDEEGERIPLTICDADPVAGTVSIVFQAVGKSTMKLARLNKGEHIMDFVGPLGRATHIEKFGTVVCIGGGIGIAPVHPIAQAMRQSGNKVISIIGARSKNLLILENEMRIASDELIVGTDDGSYGKKGFTSDMLKEVIARGQKIDLVVAIGPVPMMKAICNVTKEHNLKTFVSLNPIMLDATGMCGVCRVTVGGKTRFACVDGPEFDGHQVDFDELTKRLKTYVNDEKVALERYMHKPSCVDLAIEAQKQAK
ncbi:MAG: sulfide/dihydroorotate dehydrogenase-like FAD/NAD-binding protein [Planctomycetota bacterium]